MNYEVVSNRPVARDVYRLTLSGPAAADRPGQFVQIQLPGFYLRRPLSVCDWAEDSLTLLYKTVGQGTQHLSRMQAGARLDLLTHLGNGFAVRAARNPVLIGGGLGAAPMLGLARRMDAPTVILGFAGAADVVLKNELEQLGARVIITTADGGMGMRGFVTDALRTLSPAPGYAYACGPEPMLRAVYDAVPDGQFSFEARMACGFGACMGCSCETKYGAKRICKDGPVLLREEIVW